MACLPQPCRNTSSNKERKVTNQSAEALVMATSFQNTSLEPGNHLEDAFATAGEQGQSDACQHIFQKAPSELAGARVRA